MPYILDYLEKQFVTFDEKPFGPLDATVLTQVAMINATHVVPALRGRADFADESSILQNEIDPQLETVHFEDMLKAEYFQEMFTESDFNLRQQDLVMLAANPRYREMTVGDYISLLDIKRDAQFAAMTFSYKDEFGVVAFRGTDATMTGWKEDFNMGFESPVPAQAQALRYLENVASRLPEKLFIIGHSKGGNLAEYSSCKVSPAIQDRIVHVYNLDGPGFKEGVISEAEYAPIVGRMTKIAPKDSLVGILLFSPLPMQVVPSNSQGFGEHSVFTWELNEALDDFVYLPEGLSDRSKLLMATIRGWITKYDDSQREQLVESLFTIIANSGGTDFGSVIAGGLNTVASYLQGDQVKNEQDVATVVSAGRDFVNLAATIALTNLANQANASKQAPEES